MDEKGFYALMFIVIALFLAYLPFCPCCPWDCNKKNPCSNDDETDNNNTKNAINKVMLSEYVINQLSSATGRCFNFFPNGFSWKTRYCCSSCVGLSK